jgi:hypothetical protein
VYTATFKKIKLLITSQQKAGSQFCLRFSLKCASLDLGPLGEMAVLSNPMAVFSHTQYLGGSSPGSSSASSSSSSSSSSTITRKYAHNPVGLQLKVMEMIHVRTSKTNPQQCVMKMRCGLVAVCFNLPGLQGVGRFRGGAAPVRRRRVRRRVLRQHDSGISTGPFHGV